MANWKGGAFLLICGFCCFFPTTMSFEPLSTMAVGALLTGLGYNYRQVLKEQSICRMKECCIDRHIKNDFKNLTVELKRNVFGQPIVQEQVVHALRAHHDDIETSKKALVMSFHGTPGTGKNYVADFIAKAMYDYGLESQFVHRFSGRTDFPNAADVNRYRVELKKKVMKAIEICPKSLFIFDEVDSMPSGVFDTITPFMDYHAKVNGADFRKAIFIFLSNTGGVQIADKVLSLYRNKKITRDDFKLHHFEEILEMSAYNVKGGLKNAKPIEAALVDHFIPFLPLEIEHIHQCIEVEFKRLKVELTKEIRDEILKFVTIERYFSNTGCKRITKKAEMFKRPAKKV